MLTIGSYCQTHYTLPIYKQQTTYWHKPLVLAAVQRWTADKVLWREEFSCGKWRAICFGKLLRTNCVVRSKAVTLLLWDHVGTWRRNVACWR